MLSLTVPSQRSTRAFWTSIVVSIGVASCVAQVSAAQDARTQASGTQASGTQAAGGAASTVDASCVVLKLDQVTIAARRDGIIENLSAREGDDVAMDDLLVELSMGEAEALLRVANAKAQKARIAAENKWQIKVAEQDLRASAKEDELLSSVRNAPFLERFRATTKHARSAASLESARYDQLEQTRERDVAMAELQVARLNIEDRRIVSPMTGAILEQHKYQGDWVHRGEPILTVMRMDQLIVKGVVNVRELAPHDALGCKVVVRLNEQTKSPTTLADLTISKVASEIDIDGNYVVWTIINNRLGPERNGQSKWLIRPGMTGRMEIFEHGKRGNKIAQSR